MLAGLAARLFERGIDHVTTREPGGTAFGAALRAAFLDPAFALDSGAEALVVNASRAQLVAEVVRPALGEGRHVLCDRFIDSTTVYQGFGRGVPFETLATLSTIATGGLEPDLTLFVDVPVSVSRARVTARARDLGASIDRLEREDDTFHERVRAGYLSLARLPRFVTLDGMLARDALLEAAWAAVAALLA